MSLFIAEILPRGPELRQRRAGTLKDLKPLKRGNLAAAENRVVDCGEMLRLIDRYVLREIIPYMFLALVLLTAIIFIHQASRFSELLVVASRSGLPMEGLWRVMSALVPGILVFTVPIALLMGILVGQGRLSGDGEIVALGAGGVSRFHILRPVVALALVATLVMLYLTFNLLPRAVHDLKDLKVNQATLFHGLTTQIKPRVFEESIPKMVLYVGDIDRSRDEWRDIFIVDLGESPDQIKIFSAAGGALRQGSASEMPELRLYHGSMHQVSSRGNPEKRKHQNPENYTFSAFQETTLGLRVSDNGREGESGERQEQVSVSELTWSDLAAGPPVGTAHLPWLVEVHKRLSYPAACLVFALLGVGFGATGVRTGRSFGLLLGLAITIGYYLLALAGEHAAASEKVPVWLGVWLANMVLAAFGVAVILAQRKPGSDALSLIRKLQHLRQSNTEEADESDQLQADRGERPRGRRIGAGLPQLIDRLVVSDLVRFFLFVLTGFSSLFIIVTLFQLLDQITRNKIEWVVVANYLFFLMPMVLNYMTPLAVLVAVIVTFGLLDKSSQVVALKASGQSIYRMAAPVVLISVLLSGVIFLNQDYVLPFTNRRQDNLRHLILRGKEPPQTFYQTDHKWIFGGESRIYNYAHFDPTTNMFARLTVLELSREPFGIKGRLFAHRAYWDATHQTWLLENGWERRFEGDHVDYSSFEERAVQLPEKPEYFKKDSRESSMMTLSELRRQIADLSRAGFDVLDLKVALYSKVAFPLACLIMVVVGLPFSLSVGKRGALYGVAVALGIGLFYWGLLGLFEQMGRYEMLPPLLAGWGPNLMFGAGGLYLFLTSRT